MISKKNQNIDRLIEGLKSITKDRYSLSDDDVVIVNQAIEELQEFATTKPFYVRNYVEVMTKVAELLVKVFLLNHEVTNFIQHLH